MKEIIEEVNSTYGLTNEIILNINEKVDFSKSGIEAKCAKFDDVYYVYVTDTEDERFNEILKSHEYGHIYHGHLDEFKSVNEKLVRVIENNRTKLEEKINDQCGIDYADKLLDSAVKDRGINSLLHNIAMDLEVNSTVLDEDDLEYIKKTSSKIVSKELERLQSELGNKSDRSKEEKMKIAQVLTNMMSSYELKAVYPDNYGFKSGLRYQDYLVSCVMNLPVVLKDFVNTRKKLVKSNDGKGEKLKISSLGSEFPKTMEEFEDMMKNSYELEVDDQDESDDGDNSGSKSRGGNKSDDLEGTEPGSCSGGGEGDDDEDGNNSNSSKSDKNSDKDEDKDGDGDGSDSSDKGDEEGKNSSSSDFNDHDTSDREEYYKDPDKHNSSIGRGLQGSNAVRDYHINDDPLDLALSEILKDCRNKVIKKKFLRDFTYKYNRKILGNSKMLNASYRQKVVKDDDPTVVFCVDVSGSMDDDLVDRIITTIRTNMKKISRALKYSVAAWDTELRQYYKDIDCNTPITKLSCMGGTRLAGMFDFFKKEYDKSAILVMVSDFQDDLGEWKQKESKLDGYSLYGICYGNSGYGGYGYGYHNKNELKDFKNLKVKVV